MTTKNAHLPKLLATLDPNAIPLPSKILILLGSATELHSLILPSLFLRAQRGEHLGIIVGDNRLDAYTLAHLMRRHEFNPATLLSQIDFSRSFTCHQLHHALLHLAPVRSPHWSALYLLGLLETFYDEGIPLSVASRLLHEILTQLRGMATQGLSILVTIAPPPGETTRSKFIPRVLRAADVYWQPSPQAVEYVMAQLGLW